MGQGMQISSFLFPALLGFSSLPSSDAMATESKSYWFSFSSFLLRNKRKYKHEEMKS
jgi:hypothetical protein